MLLRTTVCALCCSALVIGCAASEGPGEASQPTPATSPAASPVDLGLDSRLPEAREPHDGGTVDAGLAGSTLVDVEIAPDTAAPPPPPAPCDRSTPSSDLPLIFYYGFFQDDAGGPDVTLNARLLQPGLDVVFGARNPLIEAGDSDSCSPHTPLFAELKGLGARLARHVSDEELGAWLEDGSAADRLAKLLRDGWDYVQVDELAGSRWFDDGSLGSRLPALLDGLRDRGQDRKVLFWFSPGTTEVWRDPATGNGTLAHFAGLFASCQARCRKLIFETYPADAAGAATNHKLTTSTAVGPQQASRYLERLATRLRRIAEGTNVTSISGIGLGNDRPALRYLDDPGCDLAPFIGACPSSPASGGLRSQLAQLHAGELAHNQRGVAFYSPAHVVDTGVWTRADLVEYLRDLTSWWIGR